MALFLTILSPQVRQLIYVECLVVGKVFPYTFSKAIATRRFDGSDSEDEDALDTTLNVSGSLPPGLGLLRCDSTKATE